LHLLNSAKTSVGASTLIVVLVWIMARIHFVRASEASLISNFAQPWILVPCSRRELVFVIIQ
ncbi:MAG: hypothetical protein J6I53_01355, partial [Treponema sp.]|nr:hypothetical protein [Treponema sp.]